ncbi:hypothetical protein ACHAWO_005921 [Cyclotella atomus]|uniref:Large ribosomal subunit protein bL28m n=1 Tax=Cyclotella atomus TaxID=382360 RepID=A0ABD3NKT6_9STRA
MFALSSLRRTIPSWLPATAAATQTTTSPLMVTSTQQRHRSNRSRRGLYDGRDIRFGNNVPFSMKKTRRRWNPNVQFKKLYSEVLDEMIKFHVTTGALRSIDKYGGLDNYLLYSPNVSTKGEGEGQKTRNRIMQKIRHREELKKQAIARGEPVEEWEDKIVLVGKKIKTAAPAADA